VKHVAALVLLFACGDAGAPREAPRPAPTTAPAPRADAARAIDATVVIPACITPGVYRLAFAKKTAWKPYEAGKDCTPARPAPVFLRLSVPRTGWVGAGEVSASPPYDAIGTDVIVAIGDDACTGQLTLKRDDLDFTGLAAFAPGEIRIDVTLARISRKDAMATVECRAEDLRLVATRVPDQEP
jgi:hypothetical protein